MYNRIIVNIMTCLILIACATRINQPLAPIQQQSKVEQFQLNQNECRVHFFLGELFFKSANGIKMNEVAELYVNNVKIGFIGNQKEYIAIDLYPGLYNFRWSPVGSGSGYCEAEQLQLSITKNELVFLKANMRDASKTNPGALLFGAVGAVVGTNVKTISYLEPDNEIKNNLKKYRLVSLNESFKANFPDSSTDSLEQKLSELKKLYEKGLVTEKEYQEKRKSLIDSY